MINKAIFDALSENCSNDIREVLCKELCPIIKSKRHVIILCIGTDRSTGDSLGPLVGEKLKFLVRDQIHIYGNLESPIHAKNLSSVLTDINNSFENPFIIAVDASLGAIENVGKIIIDSTPLIPGAALNKDLPHVGDISINGIVNISGSLEFMVLQNTRLFVVMKLAEVISSSLYHAIIKTVGGKKTSKKIAKLNFDDIISGININ